MTCPVCGSSEPPEDFDDDDRGEQDPDADYDRQREEDARELAAGRDDDPEP